MATAMRKKVKIQTAVPKPFRKPTAESGRKFESNVYKNVYAIRGTSEYAVAIYTSRKVPFPENIEHTSQFASDQRISRPAVCARV